MRTRAELLQQIEEERAAWHALLAEVGEERMDEPGPMGDWTFKDLAAHVTFWQDRMLARMAAGPDRKPPAPWPEELGDDDDEENWEALNAWIREQHRDRPLSAVLADADSWYERFAELIATMPDEHLLTPGTYAEMGGKALIEADFFDHLHDEHEPSIRAWLETR